MTEENQLVTTEHHGPVTRLTLDSPANRNALGWPLIAALTEGLAAALARTRTRVIVITGSGPAFSAGADLYDTTDPATVEQAYRDLFGTILQADKPVVARVNGHCFGIAIGLVSVCDLSVATEDALFGLTEVRLGRTATLASVVTVPRLSRSDAAELFLRGNRFDGRRAAAAGLVNAAVALDHLDAETDAVVTDLLAGGPVALATTKRLLRDLPRISDEAAWALAFDLTRAQAGTAEANEGTAAFREKREPVWPDPLPG